MSAMDNERAGKGDRLPSFSGVPGRSRPPVVARQELPPSPRSAREIVFTPPKTLVEARQRLANLDYDIAHIDQQLALRRSRDPDWLHRAGKARMMKDLERSRIRIWVEEVHNETSWDTLKMIVEVAREDYEASEWAEVLAEANRRLAERRATNG